jgi:hypothetical protein
MMDIAEMHNRMKAPHDQPGTNSIFSENRPMRRMKACGMQGPLIVTDQRARYAQSKARMRSYIRALRVIFRDAFRDAWR